MLTRSRLAVSTSAALRAISISLADDCDMRGDVLHSPTGMVSIGKLHPLAEKMATRF